MCNILSLSATPGRLNDLLMNEIMDVGSVTYLVSLNHFLILNFELSLFSVVTVMLFFSLLLERFLMRQIVCWIWDLNQKSERFYLISDLTGRR